MSWPTIFYNIPFRPPLQIAFMSQLELNSNNNDEIRREAAAIRKAHFIRALAKQYMVC